MKGSFEELDVWQEGCDLAVRIYQVIEKGPISKDFGLKDQMKRAAISIPSNIAEGKERETVPELLRYLYYAKGSAGELRTQLYIAGRIGYIDEKIFSELLDDTMLLSKKLGSFKNA